MSLEEIVPYKNFHYFGIDVFGMEQMRFYLSKATYGYHQDFNHRHKFSQAHCPVYLPTDYKLLFEKLMDKFTNEKHPYNHLSGSDKWITVDREGNLIIFTQYQSNSLGNVHSRI